MCVDYLKRALCQWSTSDMYTSTPTQRVSSSICITKLGGDSQSRCKLINFPTPSSTVFVVLWPCVSIRSFRSFLPSNKMVYNDVNK